MRKSNPAIAAMLALAACSRAADDGNILIDDNVTAAELANADVEAVPPSEDSAPPAGGNADATFNEADDSGSENSPPEPGQVVPAQYRGRWGLVPADCTSTRGDAKGLITVGKTSIRFYESVAALQERRPAIATSFSGLFVFTGEGQTWERAMTFTRTGNTLKRAETGGSFTYTRC